MSVALPVTPVAVRPVTRTTSAVMAQFLAIATVAATIDLMTKELATGLLGHGQLVALTNKIGFLLVYNTGTAGGLSIGPFTAAINVLVTIVAIAMVVRVVSPLARVDARAVRPLALLTGGALGNLASMIAGPEGVADFLAVRLPNTALMVMNVADLMLWSGALLLVPVVVRLCGAIRAERLARG